MIPSKRSSSGTVHVLDRFSVILLDMNRTFMFGEDRFGPEHDYHATYRAEGGWALRPSQLRATVDACYDQLARLYHDPAYIDDFRSVSEVLDGLPAMHGVCDDERARLERVVARHELGQVPNAYAAALQRLARTHRLGLVSNIWSHKALWLDELERASVADCFTTLVFSSDGRSIKPSPRLFDAALAAFDVPRAAVVMIGDSLTADVAPARAAGVASVWIAPAGTRVPAGGPNPDYVVPDLLTLVPGEQR